MFELNSASLGITLLVLGLAFFLLTYFMLRVIPKIRVLPKTTSKHSISSTVPAHGEAVLLVQPGGRIVYLNQTARDRFNLWDTEPNLEHLARRSRPRDVFWGLCSSAGRARFSIDGHPVEGTSYFVPNEDGNAIMLSLRPHRISAIVSRDTGPASQTFEVLTELSQSMAANLELEATLQAILRSVEQIVPTDFAEITIWDPGNEYLIPYRFVDLDGLDRHLERSTDRYPMGQGYAGYVAEHREPVLISDVDEHRKFSPLIDRRKYPFHSYLGIPLLVGGELIGTLDITSLAKNAYTENDVKLLRMLSGQAAIALHNALLYQDEQRRAQELSGLANLTQAVSSVRNFADIFARMVPGITPLLDIEIAGFLIYDESRRVLEARTPFIGIPPQFVEMYRVAIPIDSPAERIWGGQETIVSTNAPEDSRLIDLGLDHPARAAGIRDTVLIPLTSGGRSLGYLQAANKRDGTPFNQDDLRLLSIIAGHAAPIIYNADLIQQSVGRALRSESLRRIASLSGSVATLDEIFKYSLLELARLLKADIAAILLLDENLGELRVHAASIYGVPPDAIPGIVQFPINDADFHSTVTGSKRPFLAGNTSEYEPILPVYKSFVEVLGGESAIGVPLVTRDRAWGEIMLCSNLPGYFNHDDISLAATVADQLAIAIERASLSSQTDENLRRRVDQLTALTRISRELNTSVQLTHLLQRVFDEALKTTRADCGTILLFELGENRSKFLEVILRLGDSPLEEILPLERLVLENGSPLIVEDFNQITEEYDPAIWQPAHKGVRSALIVPIAYQENIAGLIHLHANSSARFDQSALQITQALAVQAAIAIGNAQRYQELVQRSELLTRRVETLANIFDSSQKLHLGQPLEQSLENIAYGIRTSTPFNIVLISVYDIADSAMHRITGAGIPLSVMDELREHSQPWQDVRSILKPEFRFGRSYYIPSDKRPAMPEIIRPITLLPDQKGKEESEDSIWHPKDLLLVPLVKPSGEPLGLISVDAPRDNRRPDSTTIETLEIFASQASLAIESQQQLRSLEDQVGKLTDQLESSIEDQKNLSILIQKDMEHEYTIRNLTRLVQRVSAGLEIVDAINRQPDRASVLSSLGKEIVSKLDMDIALVVELSPGGPRLLNMFGDIPEGVNPDALLGQRNPLIKCLQEGETLVVPNAKEDAVWQQSPLLIALDTSGFLCIPIVSNTGLEAAVLAISHSKLPPLMPEDEQLFELLSRQTATALRNLNLLTETGYRLREVDLLLDFSRQLGSLEPTRVMQTLVEISMEVAQSAQACMVALFDPAQGILVPQAAKGYTNNDAMLNIAYRPGDALPGQVFDLGRVVCIDEVDFAEHYKLSSDDLLRYREATGGSLPISCMVVPIQSGDIKWGVVVLDSFREVAAFSEEDQALISSLAQQTALILENARLYQAAEERAAQLQALSDVAAAISSSLEPEALIHSLLETLETIVPYNTGTLWLRDDNTLSIQSARGFENSADLIGIVTTVEDSRLFHEMICTNRPVSVGDIRSDSRFPSAEAEYLSWLGIPLISKGEMIGVIALEKTESHYYTGEHIRAATTFASQAAVALENATLYQQSLQRSTELDQRSRRLSLLNRFSNQISSVLDTGHILDTITHELLHALPGSLVSVVMWESEQATLRAESPRWCTDLPTVLPVVPIFEHLQETLGIFNTQDVNREETLAPLTQFFAERRTRGLLILPLVTGDIVHGFILIHVEQKYRFSADEIELARIICNQAAVALQNASLYAETIRLAEDLEQRVDERTEQLDREHKRAQSLLRIMRELSASLDLDYMLNRTLALLNETIGAEQSTVLLLRPDEKTFYYQASLGYTDPPPRGGRPSRLAIDAGLAGWVIKQRRGTLINDVRLDDRWAASDEPFDHRSAIAVPLMVGAEALGVILLFHRQVNVFSTGDEELSMAAAAQIAAAINNSALFSLIRDQAEGLGGMLRTQQIEASRSRGILEAVADGVLVTDVNSMITLFNESAQRILELESSTVIGKSLDDFAGLFGRASQAWMNTIRDWSIDPATHTVGDIYAEQIMLEDKRVVSVHLAPVNMGNEFLGTVSVFRDITHQIELDRLKSEFVATVSHELRTPMTSIKGYVEILLMGVAGSLTEQQTQFLDIVKNNTERLNILVNDLLDVSHIESGKIMLSIQPLDMRQLIETIIRDQNRRAKEDKKPISIEFDFPPDLPRISGDEEKIRRILSNIVRNAYDYTPANGCIHIRLKKLKAEIQIDVQDDGIGIPPVDQERIFERFFRGEDPLEISTGGAGLGLSIVRQLIEMHHGRIWVDSSGIPGEGSIFSFTLPLQQPENE